MSARMKRELSLFYRQIAVAYRAGLPLTQAVQMGSESCTSPGLRRAAADIERRVRSGNPLGPALAAHPKIFSELETALVTIGEEVECSVLARAVRWQIDHRVLLNGQQTIVFD